MPRKVPIPNKCSTCGSTIQARDRYLSSKQKYCSQKCMGIGLIAVRLSKPTISYGAGHFRARLIKQGNSCERCGRLGKMDVHHKDDNYHNNHKDNLERLCRSCHLKHHRPPGYKSRRVA